MSIGLCQRVELIILLKGISSCLCLHKFQVENSVIKRIAAASETSALSLELFKTWLGALPSSDGVPYKEQMMKSVSL